MFGGGRRYGGQPRDPFEDMMDHVFGGSFFGPPFQQQFGGGGIFNDLSRSGTSFGMDPFFADPFFRPPFHQQQQQRSVPPQVKHTAATLTASADILLPGCDPHHWTRRRKAHTQTWPGTLDPGAFAL